MTSRSVSTSQLAWTATLAAACTLLVVSVGVTVNTRADSRVFSSPFTSPFVSPFTSPLYLPQVGRSARQMGTPLYLPLCRREPAPTPEVKVLSSSAFRPYEGSSYWYIAGEVVNRTSSNVWLVRIDAALRDSYGGVVDSDYTYSYIDVLEPGMTSPFLVMLFDPPPWATYELSTSWHTTSLHPRALQVLNSTTYFDMFDAYHVAGETRNQYGDQQTWVTAYVTLYDASGTVIGTDFSLTNPDDPNPGQTASFDTEVYFWKYQPDRTKVASHKLQVYGY
jgi:hypothetical protein